MEDGTYIKLSASGILARVDATAGYWVASDEVHLLEVATGEYVGVWTDTETDKTWFDRAHWFEFLADAWFFAEEHNQLAIWDCRHAKEIRLDI